MLQSVPECVGQVGDGIDLVGGLVYVVLDAAISQNLGVHVDNRITGTIIVVSGLSNTADVDHYFLICQLVVVTKFSRGIKLAFFGKNARYMRVSLEAVLLNKTKDPFNFSFVVDILREHVFVQWAAGGTMHKHEIALAVSSW